MLHTNSARSEFVAAGERLQSLDVLRGLALFGILAMNIGSFNGSHWNSVQLKSVNGVWDQAALAVLAVFFSGKFLALFAFLFGVGFTQQASRVRLGGASPGRVQLRRMLVLLLFGCAHITFGWSGDILHTYALLGILSIFVARLPSKAVFATALFLLLWPTAYTAYLAGSITPAAKTEAAKRSAAFSKRVGQLNDMSRATYLESIEKRIRLVAMLNSRALQIAYRYSWPAAMMLLGVWVARREWIQRSKEYTPLWKRLLAVCGGVGLSMNFAYFLLSQKLWVVPIAINSTLIEFFRASGRSALMMSYVAAVVLLCAMPVWTRRLGWVTAAGRAPLTNYLLQTAIGTLLFYGYGLNWAGTWGPAAGFILSAPIFLAQCAASAWWFGRFEQGPLESLWRTLTYRQPFSAPGSGGIRVGRAHCQQNRIDN